MTATEECYCGIRRPQICRLIAQSDDAKFRGYVPGNICRQCLVSVLRTVIPAFPGTGVWQIEDMTTRRVMCCGTYNREPTEGEIRSKKLIATPEPAQA